MNMILKKIQHYGLYSLIALIVLGCAAQSKYSEKSSDNLKKRAQAHTDLGAVYYQQNQLEIALEEFNEAIKIDPTFGLAFNGLGLVNARLGRDDEAEVHFKKSIQIEPTNSESRNNYGSFLCARNRADEAITQYLEAVKNPLYLTPHVAYANAGICAKIKNDGVLAETYFQKALQFDPLFHIAAYQLAALQFKRHDAVTAKKTLQNALLDQATAEMLWLAILIERAVGDKDSEASYALQLKRQYPDSTQTKLLLTGG